MENIFRKGEMNGSTRRTMAMKVIREDGVEDSVEDSELELCSCPLHRARFMASLRFKLYYTSEAFLNLSPQNKVRLG